jgi:hypothetical protein
MKRRASIALAFVLLCSWAAIAQMTQPTPPPELKNLDYFAGNWTSEATIAPGPWGAGGKFSDTVSTEWMKGNFFLVKHSDFSMPAGLGGSGTAISVMSYDREKKVYTEERFDSTGRHEMVTGTLNGDLWTWKGENNYGSVTIESRFTIKMTSPTSYTSKYEVSADGGANWMSFWEGKATKK